MKFSRVAPTKATGGAGRLDVTYTGRMFNKSLCPVKNMTIDLCSDTWDFAFFPPRPITGIVHPLDLDLDRAPLAKRPRYASFRLQDMPASDDIVGHILSFTDCKSLMRVAPPVCHLFRGSCERTVSFKKFMQHETESVHVCTFLGFRDLRHAISTSSITFKTYHSQMGPGRCACGGCFRDSDLPRFLRSTAHNSCIHPWSVWDALADTIVELQVIRRSGGVPDISSERDGPGLLAYPFWRSQLQILWRSFTIGSGRLDLRDLCVSSFTMYDQLFRPTEIHSLILSAQRAFKSVSSVTIVEAPQVTEPQVDDVDPETVRGDETNDEGLDDITARLGDMTVSDSDATSTRSASESGSSSSSPTSRSGASASSSSSGSSSSSPTSRSGASASSSASSVSSTSSSPPTSPTRSATSAGVPHSSDQ